MDFITIKNDPQFTLNMTLKESIQLWKIVNESSNNGNVNADKFVDALTDFASHSNDYTEDLN